MKLMTRSIIALVFFIGLSTPLLAAAPDVSVCITPVQNCFSVTIKNLTSPVVVSTADMTIFDQKSCKRVCVSKIPIQKKLATCGTLTFKICCEKPLPPSYICYVRVQHSGTATANEGWFCR
jgi:hypothetical protein